MRAFPTLAIAILALAAACNKAPEGPAAGPVNPPAPVTAAKAERADVPVIVRTIGTAESRARVMLRPQVSARVADLAAREGTTIEANKPILELDRAPFQAALKVAEANTARAEAAALDAHRYLERIKEAAEMSAMSAREKEAAEAKALIADADVRAAKAAEETAKLDLGYCTINAPMSGRLGQFVVKPGAIVKANETDLIEIVQIDPIEVGFTVMEKNLGAVRAANMAEPLRVEARPSGDPEPPLVGRLTFFDSRVDEATGTVRVKATFDNANGRLWPGQFNDVLLIVGVEKGSILVPESAVQTSQSGSVVYVIKADGTVDLRQVKVRRVYEGKSILDSGVAEGETVVTDGQLRLAPGVKVQVKTAENPPVKSGGKA